jgi:short-subunit dehydrogenase
LQILKNREETMRTIKQLLSMEGRVAVITGGCGHIGRAIAEGLAEQGCNLLLIDRAEDTLKTTSSAWRMPRRG